MDEISYQKFLTTRICDLELDINESMAHVFKRLKKELKEHRILLWPDFYFGNEWGCMNKKISISIPFYLATPELKELEGDFNKKYRDGYLYRVNPWSKSYVRHLHYLGDPHYAQKHPDEDWAETFAIWLDPRSHWKNKYRNWPNALEKLVCLDRLMEEVAGKDPLDLKKKRGGEYAVFEESVSDWWGLDGEMLDQELQEYLNDMSELFTKPTNGRRRLLPAWKLIRKYAWLLTEQVSLWISGSNQHTIRKSLRRWEAICRNESLGYFPEEEEKRLIELTTLLTYHVMDGVHHLRN